MHYKKKEYGFNIIIETIKEDESDEELYQSGQQTKQEQKPYTENALIIQAILEYSKDFGTKNYFTRKEITENHLFPNCKVYEYKYQGDDKKSKNDVKKASIQQSIEIPLKKLTYLELVDSVEYNYNKRETSI